MILLLALACADIDTLIHNGRHCSIVGPDTCEGASDQVWGRLCTACEDPYDWGIEYTYFDTTLVEGQTVRAVDPSTLTQLEIPTDDGEGTLDAWLVPAHGEDPELAQITILYNHGNFAGIEHYLPRIRYLHELGYAVMAWDYRGYGKSEPAYAPTGPQFIADANTVLAEAEGLIDGPIALYGYSLGAIPAVEMALQDGPCALLLETPFTSMRQSGAANSTLGLPGSFLSSGVMENDQKLTAYSGPLLVMAAELDNLFPVEDVQSLYDASPSSSKQFELFEGSGHGIGGLGGIPELSLTNYGLLLEDFLRGQSSCLEAP